MTDDAIKKQLPALADAPMDELKTLWQSHFRNPPPKYQRDYMVRHLAYRIQANVYGGLPKTALNKLQRLAAEGQEKLQERYVPIPGTRLMREYNGERIYVLVQEDGFEFRGRHYKSLSAISSELAGHRVSGPKFFGLVRGDDGQ